MPRNHKATFENNPHCPPKYIIVWGGGGGSPEFYALAEQMVKCAQTSLNADRNRIEYFYPAVIEFKNKQIAIRLKCLSLTCSF
jgi:hypothetical protein